MRVVEFLLALLARRAEVMTAHCHHIVAAVCRRVPDRLVLAHQEQGNGRCDAAERAWIGPDVNMVPGAGVRQTCLDS